MNNKLACFVVGFSSQRVTKHYKFVISPSLPGIIFTEIFSVFCMLKEKEENLIFFFHWLHYSLSFDQLNLISIQLKLRFTAFSVSHDLHICLNIVNFMRIKICRRGRSTSLLSRFFWLVQELN